MSSFPDTWEIRQLGDLVDVLDAYRIPVSAKERADRVGKVPYYGATGLVGSIDGALFDEPLVLLGEDGVQFFDPNKSKAYLIDGPAWVNNHAHVLRARDAINRKFLIHYLNSADYRGFANGTTRLKLTQAAMRRIPSPVPPLDEQLRIVDILEDHLSRLDAAESGLQAARRRLSALREREVFDAVTGAAAPAPRVSSTLTPCGTIDGDLPSLPTGWIWKRLGDIADVVGGVTKDAKRQSDPALVDVPYLRVANVQRGRLALDEVTRIRVPAAKADALRLRPGDVLLNEGGDRDKLARGWVWEGQIDDCIHQNHVFRARVRDNEVDPYFLSWVANTLGGEWAQRNGKQSVNLASISLRMIRRMPVAVPPRGVSERVAKELSAALDGLDRLEEKLEVALQRGALLRRSLLEAAFSGRLTGGPSDLDLRQAGVTAVLEGEGGTA